MPLFDLFIPYSVRKSILEKLSAYDIAKMDMIFSQFLDPRERKMYLSPLRDLFFDCAEVKALQAYGLRLFLLGHDVMALRRRLQYPQSYIRKHGHSRKLQIYLVGYCPVMLRTTGIRDRILNFSLFGAAGACNLFEETMQMRILKAKVTYGGFSPDTAFILSLGALSSPSERPGFWLCVPTVPDPTIDLRVYVPSFRDRKRGEISFPWNESWHLSQCVSRKLQPLFDLEDVLCMCFSIYTLIVANLTSSGIHAVRTHGRIGSERLIDFQAAILAGENGN